jgi:Protein of unknown function (DUF2924)
VTAMAVRPKDEALSRLPKLDIRELREEWCRLYKADASPHLSRELLIRAIAYRMQEVALGGLRPEPQRQLRQIAQELKQTGEGAKRFRPQLKPGTRLMREVATQCVIRRNVGLPFCAPDVGRSMMRSQMIPGVVATGMILALAACTNPYDPVQRFVVGGLIGAHRSCSDEGRPLRPSRSHRGGTRLAQAGA